MKRFFKVIAVLIGLLLIAMILLPFAFRGKLDGIIRDEINKNVHADVDFSGLNISLFKRFPMVYLGLDDVTVTGLDEFAADTLLKVPRIDATVNLLDFFRGDYRIRRIDVVRPEVLLIVLDNGKANWDIAGEEEGLETGPETQPEEQVVISLNRFTISNGFMIYEDRSSDTYGSFSGINHTLSGDFSSGFTRIKTKTGIDDAYLESGKVPWVNHLVVDFIADIDANLENSIYTFRNNSLKLNQLVINFDGSVGFQEDGGLNLMLTVNSPSGRFREILSMVPQIYARDFESIKTDGNFSLNGYIKGIYRDDQYPSFGLEVQVSDGYFKYPDLPASVEAIAMDISVKNSGGDLDNTVTSIRNARFQFLKNQADFSLYLEKPVSDPYIRGKLDADIEMGKIRDVVPLGPDEQIEGKMVANVSVNGYVSELEKGNYEDFEALGSLLLNHFHYSTPTLKMPIEIQNAQVNFAPAYADLVDFNGSAGKSNVQLKGKMEDYLGYLFGDGELQGNFLLKSSLLDLNELMAAETDTGDIPEETTDMTIYEVPDKLFFIMNAEVDTLYYSGLSMTDVSGKITVKNRKLMVDNMKSSALGGKVSLRGSYDTWDPNSPLVDFTLGLDDISISDSYEGFYLIRQFLPLARNAEGDYSLNVSFASLLNQKMLPVLSSVTGKGNLNSGGFSIGNVNTLNLLAEKIDNQKIQSLNAGPVNLTFAIADGIMNVKPFDVKFKDIKMNLSGWTSFDREIGYTMKVDVPRSVMGDKAGRMLDDLYKKARESGVSITEAEKIGLTALVSGTLDKPKLELDLAQSSEALIKEFKEQGQKLLEEKKEEAMQQAKEEAKKIIAEGERMAEKVMAEARTQSDEIMKAANEMADKTRQEAEVQAKKLEAEAKGKSILAVTAARTAADQLRKEGNKQADNLVKKAKEESDKIMEAARKKADQIRKDAKERADKL